ncbi:citrate/2-methylcitrate synthase, partial [Clavibacter michiganensis]|uniref:citrate/2-methylcitrate synthase n=1 Tax=Clavibacter michiganensis TaxID=28447 RepID=UPI00292E5A7C
GERPTEADAKAMEVSLILYAEHSFNASTFTARAAHSAGVAGVTGASAASATSASHGAGMP